ncbi:MAG: hypothetical protein FWF94_02595 [Oscillospiraceae bacterium]|nr:hypothetical protein [Oscillospiraceae bacterium]
MKVSESACSAGSLIFIFAEFCVWDLFGIYSEPAYRSDAIFGCCVFEKSRAFSTALEIFSWEFCSR